jgi:hypothetical protein
MLGGAQSCATSAGSTDTSSPKHKHHPRTDHKHCSGDDYKGKNKSEQRPRRRGVHKKKERAMVASASDIDSSSCYSSSSSSDEEECKASPEAMVVLADAR